MTANCLTRICRGSDAVSEDRDLTAELTERVRAASAAAEPLRILGGDTKAFYGRPVLGTPLSIRGHAGVVTYDPAELVITARAGTLLTEITNLLAAHGQHLPFEPPRFGPGATIGGTVAAGLAGPARARSGPVRDYVLGVRVLTGDGRALRFGGEVMKNVAGYDLSRLMAGALGILGILLEVSLKVLPQPPAQRTVAFDLDESTALERMAALARSGLPVSASCWSGGRWCVRLDGAETTLRAASRRLGGEEVADAALFWSSVREQALAGLDGTGPLWRLSVPAQSKPLGLAASPLIEWNGAQRWYSCGQAEEVRGAAGSARGVATWFRGAPRDAEVFAPLPAPVMRLHHALKQIFDPARVLNPGRMYADL